jgi:hypothetical protein
MRPFTWESKQKKKTIYKNKWFFQFVQSPVVNKLFVAAKSIKLNLYPIQKASVLAQENV